MQLSLSGIFTVMLNACVLTNERPFPPGTLFVILSCCYVSQHGSLHQEHACAHVEFFARVTSLIDITDIRTGTVRIDLVNRDGEFSPGLDLGYRILGNGDLNVFSNVNVSLELSAAALVHHVGVDFGISDDSGVLLTWVYRDAITSNGRVHWQLT